VHKEKKIFKAMAGSHYGGAGKREQKGEVKNGKRESRLKFKDKTSQGERGAEASQREVQARRGKG